MAWQYWGIDMPDPTDSGIPRLDVLDELLAAFDERVKEVLGSTASVTVKDTSSHARNVPQRLWTFNHPTFGTRTNTPLYVVDDIVGLLAVMKVTTTSIAVYGSAGWTVANGEHGEFWEACGTTESEYDALNNTNIPTRRTLQILRSAASKIEWVGRVYGVSADYRVYFFDKSTGIETTIGSGTSLFYQNITCQAANATRVELDYTFPVTSKMATGSKIAIRARQRTVGGATAYTGSDRLILTADSGPEFPNMFYPHCGAAPDSEETEVIATLDTVNDFTLSARASNYNGASGTETLESYLGANATFEPLIRAYRPAWDYP